MMRSINPMMLFARLHRLDGNPLRRRSDRLESAVFLAALVLILVSLWPAVLAYESVLQDEPVSPDARHQVLATLLEDAPTMRVSFTEVPAGPSEAAVRWTTASVQEQTARVPVPALAKSGSAVPVWLDAAGKPAPRPSDKADLQMRGVGTGMLLVLATALLALGSLAGFRRWLDRARYRQWGDDWARTEEKWRHPRRP
ncbi:hypothetical protein GCM10022419_046350 [Nonomuraea rosea]|uniref:Transmembrane protein n=1 Tax=Nonomuraea rosea TaxID=638574 RepID=A0ABP6X6P3_9ACTN